MIAGDGCSQGEHLELLIHEPDQQAGEARRKFSRAPAAVWRAIDFAHDPSLRDLAGWTEMRTRLERRGWDNQGTGSTVAALAARGLIRRGSRPTTLGIMTTVTLAAGIAVPGALKAALGRRSWEVLALLWGSGQRAGNSGRISLNSGYGPARVQPRKLLTERILLEYSLGHECSADTAWPA